MEVSNSLLVAMMFVMVLSISIGNLLMTLAGLVDRQSALKSGRVQTNWMILLLLVHFSLFWHVIDLLAIKEWTFTSFLFMIAGPILILFATVVITPQGPPDDESDLFPQFLRVSRQFFLLLALLQLWILATDFILGSGFVAASLPNAMFLLLSAWLASTRHAKTHTIGVGLGWILFLVPSILRGAGVIG